MKTGCNYEDNTGMAPYEPLPAVCCCESSGRPIPGSTITNAGCRVHVPSMFSYVGPGAPANAGSARIAPSGGKP